MHNSPIALLAAIAFLAACSDSPTTPSKASNLAGPSKLLGNGFPQGGHDYHLNIIGVPKDKNVAMDNSDGHRIFVRLQSTNVVTAPGGKNNQLAKGGGDDQNHIYLCNSTNGLNDVTDPRCDAWRATHANQFGVIDANATDGDGAIFGIPDPCVDDNLASTACTPGYSVWARTHGAPGGSATLTTCATDTVTTAGDTWCGSNGITLYAKQRKAVDISGALLHMTLTIDGTQNVALAGCLGTTTTGIATIDVYLFDDCFQNYFWNYDNNGLKLMELRFYSAS